jgi:hypothetical protein
MRLRGHFIGGLTLAITSIACASAIASGSDSAMNQRAHHHVLFRPAPGARPRLEGFAIADQSLAELYNLSLRRPVMTMTYKKLHAFLMEDPT